MDRLSVEIVPALKDNYIYLIHSDETGETAVVDPSESTPALMSLKAKGWQATHIFNTHHHWDHTDGNLEIKEATGCKIVGFKGDAHRIPGIDIELEDGEKFEFGGEQVQINHIPGHTLGAISFYFPPSSDSLPLAGRAREGGMVFTGDTLFAMGCGRLFEGTPEQMFNSLQKLKALPDDTKVYCGHEYTLKNAEFSLTIEPDNEDLKRRYEEVKMLRVKNQTTMPSTIGLEKKTNPFLRVENVEEFTEIRNKRSSF